MTNTEIPSEPTPEEVNHRFLIEESKLRLLDEVLHGKITQLEYDDGIEKLNDMAGTNQSEDQE